MFRQFLRRVPNQLRFYSSEAANVASQEAAKPKVVSSVPAGTILKGCNVRKNGEDPKALADEEYPAWLWEVLDPEIQKAKLEADPIKAARKQRRELNRKKIKEQNFLAGMHN